jgi:predicted nucleic acid-binding Zn ribbon protein
VFPVQSVANTVLAEIIRRQPASAERTQFVWTVAVGPALARATTVEMDGHALVVRARDARWAREVKHAADIVLLRLQHLLGSDAIREIRVTRHSTLARRPSTLEHRTSKIEPRS